VARGPVTPRIVRDRITYLARDGWDAPQIEKLLRVEFAGKDVVPAQKTIRDYVRRARLPKEEKVWTLAEARDGTEARLVLETIAAINSYGDRLIRPSVKEAYWIALLGKASPSLPPFERWRLAITYTLRLEHQEDTADLDLYLAFHPWTGGKKFDGYRRGIEAERFPAAPFWLPMAVPEMEERLAKAGESKIPRYELPKNEPDYGSPALDEEEEGA